MSKFKKGLLAAGAILSVALPAYAAGYLTNGLPLVLPGTSYFASNGQTTSSGGSLFTYSGELGGYELLPADTQLGGGAIPQSVAPTVFQVAALAAAEASNAIVSTAGAAPGGASTTGQMTYAAPAIAAGATLTITLTDTAITAASKLQVAAYGTTGLAQLQVVSVVPAAGSAVIIVKNIGSATTTGAIALPFQVQ